MISNTPTFTQFDPHQIKYQKKVIDDIYHDYNYNLGTHEILLSGSVGSAKSTLAAHLAVRHCIENKGARLLLGRKALPDLKDTIFRKIIEHLEGTFVEGRDYTTIDHIAKIKFRNGSEILSRSWSDKKYKKLRSLDLSAAIIEELVENNEEDKEAYDELKMRVGRIPHIKTPWIISCTNPSSPDHWAYKYFIASNKRTRHVYYSNTFDNPFLPPQYINQLKEDLDPKLARRMIYGEWIELFKEVIYYAYSRDRNYKDISYKVNRDLPVGLSWDFNIGDGKPLSVAVYQFDGYSFHFFGEVVVEGMRTEDSLEELANKGFLDIKCPYFIINGDATGKNRDTRSKRSDYDIIYKYMSGLSYIKHVPPANPPVRRRHNLVNAYCQNSNNDIRLFVYKDCPTIDEGLRLAALKKGGNYVEDDSKYYQHITTALGYAICYEHSNIASGKTTTKVL